jgi:enoyl-CoA hydratase
VALTNYKLEGSTAIVQMDDGKANALSGAMISELRDAVARAEKEATAMVLAGRPDRFCAGFDLKVMMSSPDAARTLVRDGADLLMRLYGTPLALVVACTGHALAAGALVLLTADARVGTAGAYRIGLNEVSIGLPVPVLAMELARARVPVAELARATLHARIYAPDEAVASGFLDEVLPAGDVVARAVAEAGRLGGMSRAAYSGTKERLRRATIERIMGTLDEDMRAFGVSA